MALAVLASTVQAQSYTFQTIAGNFDGDGLDARNANISLPIGIAFDSSGNLYIAQNRRNRIRKITPNGVISTIAGNGTTGSRGNGTRAQLATLNGPQGLAFDTAGNLYFADADNNLVRKISAGGIITTVAGTGASVSAGDGGPTRNASMARPYGIAVDGEGNLFVGEYVGQRVRKITSAGIISTVAGNGIKAYGGDGGTGTDASINNPAALAVDAAGNLYISDSGNHRIQKLSTSGIITTVAGIGTSSGASGDGGPATAAVIGFPFGVAVNAVGDIYISDGNCFLRKVDSAGIISTIAGGDGFCGTNGDYGPARDADVDFPEGIAFAPNGDLHFADSGTSRVRKISGDFMFPVAGVGSFGGDGGPAVDAILGGTFGVGIDASGNTYIPEHYPNNRVRKVSPAGTISTLGEFFLPQDVAVDSAGNLYIADSARIRKISLEGVITTVAGGGTTLGDGGPATAAQLRRPSRVVVDASGNIYIADTNNNRVRKVGLDGIITTVAGNGSEGFSGDGGPATSATISRPRGVALDAGGNLYIADYGHHRIRKVTPAGIISTVAGNGMPGSTGDGGAATDATINPPTGIAIGANGDLFIANGTLRKVASDGTISTIRDLHHTAYDVAINANGVLYIAVPGGRILKGIPSAPLPRRTQHLLK